ncbi:MAG: isoprenylcysteine carboxylmethyltransferase family protein [Bacteroidales bacterium]|nr:isoprenylcysteine carboxylmethyltransferase family protein [Bacteroidales bacterium]
MKAIQLLIKSLIGTIFFLLILFISAGRIDYWQGWLYGSINIISTVINTLALYKDKELAEERSKYRTGTKSWDKLILGLLVLINIIINIVAGLDSGRYYWSPQLHWGIYLLGIVLILGGEVIFLTAQIQNKFFSSAMRIQTDRGHTVCETGLYKVIRHPGYLGMIISVAGIPLILGSLWCIIPSSLSIILILIRTYFEDRTLINELNGYREYTYKTRYKLIPCIW